jgi:F-type H+-transporting ATPase subunit b
MDGLAELGINAPMLIAQVVNFGILFLILRFAAYKPIMKMMDARSNKIKESLEQAERIKQQSEVAEQETAKRIEEANANGQKIVGQAVQAAEEVKRRAEQDAKKEADALLVKAQAEIIQEKEAAIAELRKEVADLAVMVAGKAISTSLDKDTQRKIIDNALKEASAIK